MSWLRDHFYRFVFPAFFFSDGPTNMVDGPRDFIDTKVPASAPDCLPTELKKLWGLCAEYKVPWSWDVKETSYGSSRFRESAQVHAKLLRNTLDSAVVAMRTEGCNRLLLAGRDVWALAVIAEKRGVPYVFIPEISRLVVNHDAVVPFLETKGVNPKDLLIDTGFVGSIPKALSARLGWNMKFRLMSQTAQHTPKKWLCQCGNPDCTSLEHNKWHKKIGVNNAVLRHVHPEQLFPCRKKAREEALNTEYLAKYWRTGTIRNDKVAQLFGTRMDIQRAALLTSMLWRGIERFSDAAKLMNTITSSSTILGWGNSLANMSTNTIQVTSPQAGTVTYKWNPPFPVKSVTDL